jgi:hypothetical protein
MPPVAPIIMIDQSEIPSPVQKKCSQTGQFSSVCWWRNAHSSKADEISLVDENVM